MRSQTMRLPWYEPRRVPSQPCQWRRVRSSGRGSSVVVGDRLRVETPRGLLTPAVREALATNKAALLELLRFADEYRTVLKDTTMSQPAFHDAQARLIDELGPSLATAIHQSVEREYATGSGPNRNPPTVNVNGSKNRAARD